MGGDSFEGAEPLMTGPAMTPREFVVGDQASFHVTIDDDMVKRFVALTGDDNRVHVDADFARATALGKPVVHGMLTAAFVSTLIGKHLPGEGALWVAQEFNFRQPARVGETLEFKAVVVEIHQATELLLLQIEVKNERGQIVVDGRGKVRMVETRAAIPQAPANGPGVALVTGASGAVGAACSLALARQGHPVILAANRSAPIAGKVVDRIIAEGGRAKLITADLSDEDEIEKLCRVAGGWHGSPTVLVHCASSPISPRPAMETRWRDVDQHMGLAVKAFLRLAQEVVPGMVECGGGSIVAVTSQAADEVPPTGWMSYVAAKAAMQSVAHSLAAELGPKNVRVNLVSPGLMETEFSIDVPERRRLMLAQQTPLRRLCRPEDVADAVAFLAGPNSQYLTGETIRLTGGRVMQ